MATRGGFQASGLIVAIVGIGLVMILAIPLMPVAVIGGLIWLAGSK